jgi:hypothetical protein
MADEPRLRELSQTVAGGLLAEDVVYATTRLLERRELEPEDVRALRNGHTLLSYLVRPRRAFPTFDDELDTLAGAENAINTLRAARSQAAEGDVAPFLQGLVDVLGEILEDPNGGVQQVVVDHQREIDAVRMLFLELGRVTLSQANSLSRSPDDRLSWLDTTSTSHSWSPPRGDRFVTS